METCERKKNRDKVQYGRGRSAQVDQCVRNWRQSRAAETAIFSLTADRSPWSPSCGFGYKKAPLGVKISVGPYRMSTMRGPKAALLYAWL
jgi:hypothetical protein